MSVPLAVSEVEMLVIGGGPVGLMCALEAKRMGVNDLRLVDKATKQMEICKASTVWPRTLELLKYAHPAVYADMKDYANKVAILSIYRGKAKENKTELMAKIDLEGRFNSEVETAFCLEQFMTERFLSTDLEKRFGISIERGVAVKHFQDMGSYVRVELHDAINDVVEIVHTKYLVGCDGAHSFTRKNLNLHYPGEAFNKVFVIAHCKIDGLQFDNKQIWTVLNEDGIAFAAPMPNDTWELIFDLSPEQAKVFFGSDKPRDPTITELNRLIMDRVPGTPANAMHSPLWLGHFRIHSRQVERYSVGRVFMCGDACHIHSPAGGQGMNFGMQDACNIGWKLGLVLRGTTSSQLLNSYHLERWPVGRLLVLGTETQSKIIFDPNPIVRQMQFLLLPIVGNHASALASKAAPVIGETIYSYRNSPLSVEHWCFESLSYAFSNLFLRFDPERVLQRRRTGITRFITNRLCAGDRIPDAALSSSFGKKIDNIPRSKQRIAEQRTSKFRLLFGGENPDVADSENVGNDVSICTIHSLCSEAKLTALLFEAAPGYGDSSFGHGGQETDLKQVAWKLETLTDGLIKAHVIGCGERNTQRAFNVVGQCMYLVRPDGYVAFRSQPVDINMIIRYLQSTMGVKIPMLQEDNMALEDGLSSSHESDLTTVIRMLGLVSVLLTSNIVMTWYTSNA
mmetsp:Transcript_41731/g.46499  ORF Transcript_41731/g.46499 Transcript_41731/m.46499 type:complete len:681 (+) Transcript_41731:40-2082(+)